MLWIVVILNVLIISTFSKHYALCPLIKRDGLCKSCGKDCFLHNSDQHKFIAIQGEKDLNNDNDNECNEEWIICSSNPKKTYKHRRLLNQYIQEKKYPINQQPTRNIQQVLKYQQQSLPRHRYLPNPSAFGGGQPYQPPPPMQQNDQYTAGNEAYGNDNVHDAQRDQILFALGFETGYGKAMKDHGSYSGLNGYVQDIDGYQQPDLSEYDKAKHQLSEESEENDVY